LVLSRANGKEAKVKPRDYVREYHKESYYQQLLEAMGRCLPKRGLPLQVANGKIGWTPRMLVICATLMSWASSKMLKDRFEKARSAVVGMYNSRKRPGATYEGFIAALARRSAGLLAVVCQALQKAVGKVAGEFWTVEGWLLFGADGSRIECPMTAGNEEAFGCGGKKKTTPQQYIVTLFHVGTGLIWAWRRGLARASERGLLREMLDLLPPGAMLLADAGFTGYDLLKELRDRQIGFLIRVGSNVRLLKGLGYQVREHDGIVYVWPEGKRKKGVEPLRLRLIVLHDGKKAVYLLTNVLEQERLSDAQAGRFYRLRWGVELLYRALKQTLEHRKLLSDSPRHAQVELDWTMVGLWMLGLMSLEAMRRDGYQLNAWGVARSLRVVREAMDKGHRSHRQGGLRQSLGQSVKDEYRRTCSKKARHWPHKKTERPPGAPQIRTAEPAEVMLAQQLRERKRVA